jgi:hypothetical protein
LSKRPERCIVRRRGLIKVDGENLKLFREKKKR